jgi:hypothetical protein
MRKLRIEVLLVAAAFLVAPLCATVVLADPPAHAPAHGWRRKQFEKRHHVFGERKHHAQGPDGARVEFVWDDDSGVYVAVTLAKTFYSGGKYFRIRNGHWQIAPDLAGSWDGCSKSQVPLQLFVHYMLSHSR